MNEHENTQLIVELKEEIHNEVIEITSILTQSLESRVDELERSKEELKKKNLELERKLKKSEEYNLQLVSIIDTDKQISNYLPFTASSFFEMQDQIRQLMSMFENSASGKVFYDLKRIAIFKEISSAESQLILDVISKQATGEILNNVLKKAIEYAFKANKPTEISKLTVNGFTTRYLGVRTITGKDKKDEKYKSYGVKEWITRPTSLITLGSITYDNTFDTANPVYNKKTNGQVTLGTGTGKSTFFLRCLAFRHNRNNPSVKKGVTLVVPNSALVGSVLDSHNNWLSQGVDGNDTLKRITICPICGENHTAKITADGYPLLDENEQWVDAYQTIHNGESNMINVFTWYEFLEAFLDPEKSKWIKPWVVFDEAHDDSPRYQALIECLDKSKKLPFQIVKMSATFSDMPTSGILTGKMIDFFTLDIARFITANHNIEFFSKKVVIFHDDIDSLDYSELDSQKIKYIKLNDSLKAYATTIVNNESAPLLIFCNNDYSVGFTFGDVNVISTGYAQRTIYLKKGTFERFTLEPKILVCASQFADSLQQRGRGARNKDYSAIWLSMLATNDTKFDIKEISKDFPSQVIRNWFNVNARDFQAKLKAQTELLTVINYFKNDEKKAENISKEVGRNYLIKVLINDLATKIHPNLLELTNSEKAEINNWKNKQLELEAKAKKARKHFEREPDWNRRAGEYIFENNLVEYFDSEDLAGILIEATNKKIKSEFFLKYKWWYEKAGSSDDFIVESDKDAEKCGFYLQARDLKKTKYKVRKHKRKIQLVLHFQAYNFEEEHKEEAKISEAQKKELVESAWNRKLSHGSNKQ